MLFQGGRKISGCYCILSVIQMKDSQFCFRVYDTQTADEMELMWQDPDLVQTLASKNEEQKSDIIRRLASNLCIVDGEGLVMQVGSQENTGGNTDQNIIFRGGQRIAGK